MYERMLDQSAVPSMEEFLSYCAQRKELLEELNQFIITELNAETNMRFPYGKKYGWSIQYLVKNKHFCDVFAEKNAFNAMIRLSDGQCRHIYDTLQSSTKELLDNKYPCGKGGWVHMRVLNQLDLEDLKKFLMVKMQLKET